MVAKYLIFGLFLMALAWGAFLLAILNDTNHPPLSYDRGELALRLMVLPGNDRDDCFLLGLNGNGSGWFRGHRGKRRGAFEFTVTEERIERLHSMLYERGFFWMDSILPLENTHRLSSGAVIPIPRLLDVYETTHLDVRIGNYRKRVVVFASAYPEIEPIIQLIEGVALVARWDPVPIGTVDGPLCLEMSFDPASDLSCRLRNDTDEAFTFTGVGGRPIHSYQYREDDEWHFRPIGICGNATRRCVSLPKTGERVRVRDWVLSRADTLRIGVPVCYRGSWTRFYVWSDRIVTSTEEVSAP